MVPHAPTAIKQHGAFSIVGPSAWNSLPSEIHSLPRDLSSYLTSSLKLLFSPGPELGAPLSSYLEVALYKFHRWMDEWMNGWMAVICKNVGQATGMSAHVWKTKNIPMTDF